MFEARMLQASILKKIIEAIRELVKDANLDCNENGITMQVAREGIPKSRWVGATSAPLFSSHTRSPFPPSPPPSTPPLLRTQAMDSSHVSLCALQLRTEAFDHYRCDKALALGVNTENFAKLLKCSGNEDVVTLKSEEEGDMLTMTFEKGQDRISEFALKLMDIESEHLGIPDTEYKCTVRMPSNEFQRIIRDLQVLGDTCTSADGMRGGR